MYRLYRILKCLRFSISDSMPLYRLLPYISLMKSCLDGGVKGNHVPWPVCEGQPSERDAWFHGCTRSFHQRQNIRMDPKASCCWVHVEFGLRMRGKNPQGMSSNPLGAYLASSIMQLGHSSHLDLLLFAMYNFYEGFSMYQKLRRSFRHFCLRVSPRNLRTISRLYHENNHVFAEMPTSSSYRAMLIYQNLSKTQLVEYSGLNMAYIQYIPLLFLLFFYAQPRSFNKQSRIISRTVEWPTHFKHLVSKKYHA